MSHLNFIFSDQVLAFGTRNNELFVLFENKAAEYILSSEQGNFIESVAKLARSWQQSKPIKVCVHGTQILTIDYL